MFDLAVIRLSFALTALMLTKPAVSYGCGNAANLSGPENDVVVEVADYLKRAGIDGAAQPGCPSVSVIIGRRANSGEFSLKIRDSFGRHSERFVSSAAVASVLISSWARSDLGHDLLGGTQPERSEEPPGFSAIDVSPSTATGAGLVAESTLSGGRALFAGARFGACMQLGPSCVGIVGRLAFDQAWVGESAVTPTRRLAAEGLLSLQMPIFIRHLTLLPGLAAGLGGMRSVPITNAYKEEEGDVQDRSASLWHFSPRFEGAFALLVPLSEKLFVEFSLALSLSPWGETQPLIVTGNQLPVASEPTVYGRTGIGLRLVFL